MRSLVVDMVIKNGRIATPNGIYRAALAIDGGKIVAISKNTVLPQSDITIDAKGNIVMPGVIDAHVHVGDPGHSKREDWTTVTCSAAGGGVTTIIDHAISDDPPTINQDDFRNKIEYAEKQALVDFALHSAIIELRASQQIHQLIREGAAGFKMFMSEYFHVDDGTMLKAFRILAEGGGLAMVHAENMKIVTALQETLEKEKKNSPRYYPFSRPSFAEVEATYRAILFATQADCELYIVHMSTPSAVELVKQCKHRSPPIYAETCPQYLLLNNSLYDKKWGPYACMNPPLRSETEREGMWKYVDNGTISVIGTDHASYLKSEKEPGWKNVWSVPPGAPGVETMVPLLMDQVNKGRLTIHQVVRLVSYNPARIFGLYPRKGTIQVGSDGDITIIDMKKTAKISSESLHSKAEFTLYEDWEVKGVPVTTILRGNIVMEDGYPGKIIGEIGYGRFLPSRRCNDTINF